MSVVEHEGRFGEEGRFYNHWVPDHPDGDIPEGCWDVPQLLREAAGEEPREAVEEVLGRTRKGAHHSLQKHTRLGSLARSWAGRADIVVSNRIPPDVLLALAELPPALLWVLSRKRELTATHRHSRELCHRFDLLDSHFSLPSGTTLDGVAQTPAVLQAVLEQADRAQVASRLLRCRGDVLGAYFYRAGRIELYWVVIWLVAAALDLKIEDLTKVVLLHELAHAYTHLGPDADQHDWLTDAFAHTDDRIVEGLAQFYTEWVCRGALEGEPSHAPPELQAFLKLRERQSLPYRHYAERWHVGHPKQAEVVRLAMVLVRSHGITEYDHFLGMLDSEAARLG